MVFNLSGSIKAATSALTLMALLAGSFSLSVFTAFADDEESEVATPILTAEEFVTHVGENYKGISVGFRTEGFGTVTSASVTITRADGTTVTKTAAPGVLGIINRDTSGGDQLTAPIFIQEGSLTEAVDSEYWNPAPSNWSLKTRPTSVTITVADENGSKSVTNSNFSEGAPSWPTYESLLAAPACGTGTFDDFVVDSVNNQGGWRATGPYDQAIVNNIYGHSTFGCKSLRVSNAITSGSFGDWIFSPIISNEAGETEALNADISSGTRYPYFEAQFDIASADPSTVQTGLQVSVSPDRGDGTRVSFLRFEDREDGINVVFSEYVNGDFNTVTIPRVVMDRAVPHTIKLAIEFVDGAGNDIVKIFIDGALVHTGTSWEDYYREHQSENAVPTVASLLIQARSSAGTASETSGKGFLFDNLTLSVSEVPVVTPPPTPTPSTSGGGGSSGGSRSRATTQSTVATPAPVAQVLGASTNTFHFYVNLGVGMTHSDVTELQKVLMAKALLNIPAATGYYGSMTAESVRAYQASKGIDATGYFGPLTRSALNAELATGMPVMSEAQIRALLEAAIKRIQELLDAR